MTAKPSSVAELEAWIEATLRAAGTPGAAVILERDGERLLARGFGRRDVEAGLAPDVETVFGCGSVTKSLTALAILLLEEDGKLATSDAVTTHLPELHPPGPLVTPVTIHHLLTHTSGLPPLPARHYAWLSQEDLEPFERAALGQLPPRPPITSFDDLIQFLSEYAFELHAPPGEQFSYSNEGYNLLGAIVERVSGQSLPAFVSERILAPAGMTRSSLDLQSTLSLPNVTTLYVRHDGEVAASANWFNPRCWSAAGALRSTAADLARFFRMLASDGVLDGVRIASSGSIRKMTAAYTARNDASSYGYGLCLSELDGHALAYHGGGHKGVTAFAGFAAAERVICTVLTNLSDAPVEPIWAACMRAALGLPPGPLVEPPKPIELELETLRSFAGAYESLESGRFSVAVDDAGGVLLTTEGGSVRAVPVARDTLMFTGPQGEQTVRFLHLGRADVSHAYHGGRVIKRVQAPAD
jgi:CubicO group peptidase (beta-lactamase class C family)